MIAPPHGFLSHERGHAHVVVAREISAAALAAGLDRPWDRIAPRPAGPGTGRGPRGLVELDGGPRVLVKQYLRGGALARVNRARYFGLARFARELSVSRSARLAGLPVGETLGVVLAPARPGWHAYGLARWIEGAEDMARLLARDLVPAERVALWHAARHVMALAFDAGLEHRDLNLGNLVARRDASGAWEVFLVDFDKAAWWGTPVPKNARERVRARLARSHRKIFGNDPPA